MPEIKNVLVTAYIKPENQKKLKQALAPANDTFCVPYGPGAKEKIRTSGQRQRRLHPQWRFRRFYSWPAKN